MYIRVAPHVLGLLAELRESPPQPLPRVVVEMPAPLSGRRAVVFDSAGSAAPKGSTVEFAWDFGDGTAATGPKVEHSYAVAGRYQAILSMKAGKDIEKTAATVSLPPPEVLTADRARAVLIEAEAFSGQDGGKVKVATDRRGTSGPMVTGWEQNLGHWLEWAVKVPAAGRYRLVLKYCSGSPAPRRELAVDGTCPAAACKEIRFDSTGGFSAGADDWRYLTVGGEAQPVLLELTAGEHRLRLTNRGDGLGLDWLLLLPAP
jgi:hypothetical protein